MDPRLGVDQPPYQLNREYLDEYAFTTVTSHAARQQPNIGHFGWCGTAYSNASRNYLFELATFFPSDLIVRALASIRRVVELPFSPVPGIDDDDGKVVDWGAGHGLGLTMVVSAIALALAANLRVGLFLIFFLLYFGSLPVIQFDHRHFFYLIFITWWAGGFLIQAGIDGRPAEPIRWLQAFAIPAGVAVVLALALWAARMYQQPVVRALLSEYLAASREPIPATQLTSPQQGVRAAPRTDPETTDFIVVELNGSRCDEHAAVGFQYRRSRPQTVRPCLHAAAGQPQRGADAHLHADLRRVRASRPSKARRMAASTASIACEIRDDYRCSLKPFFLLAGGASRCISVSRTDKRRVPARHHPRAAPPGCQPLATLPRVARV